MKVTKGDRLGLAVFILPALILFVVFYIFPLIYVFVMSFFKWNGISAAVFTGFDNFTSVFKDSAFRHAIKNNLIWSFADVFVKVPLALIMALILSKKFRGWKLFRTIYFLPQVISSVALASLWSAVYNYDFGLLNGFLKVIGLGHLAQNWLGNVKTAFPCLVIYGLLYVGYFMVIMMAEITSIDISYYEAARLDGASELQTNIHVTIPLIRSSIVTCVTLGAVFGLRAFEQVYLLTNGGPANRTSTMVVYVYQRMEALAYGNANAASLLLIVLGVFVMVTVRKLCAQKE